VTAHAGDLTVGERTRHNILRVAVDVASVEGLDGLSIGRLASELEMSKSGLFAHFGSKEDLQLATIDAARERFIEEVFRPAMNAERGLPRLEALCRAWLSYAQRKVFRGGCFFAAASAEFDSRPGVIRDRVAAVMAEWTNALETAVRKAQQEGDLAADLDVTQLAFEINAMMFAANWAFQLYGNKRVFTRAKNGIEGIIGRAIAR